MNRLMQLVHRLFRRRAVAVFVGVVIAVGVIGPVWANSQSSRRHTDEIARLRVIVTRLGVDERALRAQVLKEAGDVARLCKSAQGNRQVIKDLVTRNGAIALASIDTSRFVDRQLAALVDLLVQQMKAGIAGEQKILDRPIPCASVTP